MLRRGVMIMKSLMMIFLLCPLILMAPPAFAKEERCKPTEPDGLGPFYTAGAPVRSSVGKGYTVSGAVRSAKDCSPVRGAQIEFWLAGPNGKYDDDHRATMHSDDKGAFRFGSNYPPSYSGRPSHIHIRVSAGGFKTLVTQHYPGKDSSVAAFDLVLIPAE